MEEYSLLKILREDLDFADALKAKTAAVKKDKETLLNRSHKYTKLYQDEILEGTKKRQKLLSDGIDKGLTEEEIFKNNTKFYPTINTPILNFLYFLLREEDHGEQTKIKQLIEQYTKEYGYDNFVKLMSENADVNNDEEVEFEDVVSDDNTNQPEEMDSYLFENIGHEVFKKIKKLKALSYSENSNESALAYKKCRELCDEYKIDFNKIKCGVE